MTSSHVFTANPSDPPTGAQPPIRASDADRAATVAFLQESVGRGLLTYDEGDERIAAAFAARFLHELPPLTADLPASKPAPPGWRRLGVLLTEQVRLEVRTTVAAGPRSRRFLVTVLLLVLVTGLLLTLGGLVMDGIWQGGHEHQFEVNRYYGP
jgi:hypothetical protein